MKKARKQTHYMRKDRQTLLSVIAAFVLIVSVGVAVFLRYYNAYIDGVLYRERLSQMKEVTTQLFAGLEDVVQNQWKDVDAFCNYIELGKPDNTESLLIFLNKQVRLNNMKAAGEDLIAVDDLGRYLTQDGWQGTLEEMDLLLDAPERVSFVSKSLTSDETRMCFLYRLPEPVEVRDGERTVRLIYYGVSKDMKQLDTYFTCAAYDNSNSVYVLNRDGMRLFRSGGTLIEGYNAYSVLEDMEYLHGHSFEDARDEMTRSGCGYANAVLDGAEYYYALYRMEHAEWMLLFLVPSAHVATNVVSMVNTTLRLILVFALILLGICAAVIFIILRFQQKSAVDAERRNNERLSAALSAAERAEQAATEANRAKSDFLANMSHDIRTPMNAIVGITKLMAHDRGDPAKMDTYIHKVQQSSQHLLGLINDVLDMSKIESSGVTLNREPIRLAEQVGQVESIIRPQVDERDQTLTIRVHEIRHEYLIGDAVRLRQIFINLLSNAVKYTPNGGAITFDLAELPGGTGDTARFRFAVSDNGYGMAPEFMTHIFEPFTRAENSTTNRVQGTGLGMAITKNIVDLMGGTITVRSELNRGSCFTVEAAFPIDRSATPELPVRRILLITDEPQLISNARAALTEIGAELHIAQSAAEADAVFDTVSIELVLLGGSLRGEKLPEHIGRLREKAKQAILIYCCDPAEQMQVRAMVSGGEIDGLVVRPFFLSNLVQAINRVRSELPLENRESQPVLQGKRFLCAEDNSLNAEILSAILDMNGAQCTIYPDGKALTEAFAAARPGDYDAILMDIQMPVMNGLDATRAIRSGSNPLGRTIPIIAMTANAFSEDVQNCLNAGMDAHVAKPIDIGALERAVQSAGGGHLSAYQRRTGGPRSVEPGAQ